MFEQMEKEYAEKKEEALKILHDRLWKVGAVVVNDLRVSNLAHKVLWSAREMDISASLINLFQFAGKYVRIVMDNRRKTEHTWVYFYIKEIPILSNEMIDIISKRKDAVIEILYQRLSDIGAIIDDPNLATKTVREERVSVRFMILHAMAFNLEEFKGKIVRIETCPSMDPETIFILFSD